MRSTTVVNHAQETRNAERGTRNEHRGAYDLTEEQELFKQKKRLADAERVFQAKTTKKAEEEKRIAASKIEWAMGKLSK